MRRTRRAASPPRRSRPRGRPVTALRTSPAGDRRWAISAPYDDRRLTTRVLTLSSLDVGTSTWRSCSVPPRFDTRPRGWLAREPVVGDSTVVVIQAGVEIAATRLVELATP
ncbi:hypothetical protein V3N99_14530 [Dermatophilaceae bacterium Soc4.6]